MKEQISIKKGIKALVFGSVIAMLSVTTTWATNGMRVIGVGPIQRSMGGASVAMPLDAATTITNPAGMMLIESQVNFGASLFSPKSSVTIDGFGASNDGDSIDSNVDTSPMPALGMVLPTAEDSNMKVGIGAYGVAGMGVDYDNLPGFGDSSSNYSMMKFAPAFAMKFGDLSIGAAYNMSYATMAFSVENYNYDAAANSQFGAGYTFGAIYQIGDLNLGLAYETKQDFKDFEFTKDGSTSADTLAMDQPPVLTVGVGYTLGDLKIAFDYSQIKWSETLGKDQPKDGNGSFNFNMNWSDQTVMKLGAQYQVSQDFVVRGGYNVGANPVDEKRAFENIMFPAIVETHLTLGASYAVNERVAIDFGYMSVAGKTIDGDFTEYGMPSTRTYETTLSETSMEIGVTADF